MLLLAPLLACRHPPPEEASAPIDTGATTPTGDSTPSTTPDDTGVGDSGTTTSPTDTGAHIPALPEVPPCEGLTDPWELQTFGDFTDPIWYGTPDLVDIAAFRGEVEYAADAYGCPARREVDGVTVLEGDCDVEDFAFSGTWTYDGVTDTLVGVTVDVRHLDETFEGDGWIAYDAGTSTLTADIAYAQSGTGDFEGAFEYRDFTATWTDTRSYTDGRIALDVPEGTGDFCLYYDDEATSCEVEPQTTLAFTENVAWVLVQDGETYCDGCSALYKDGVLDAWGCE